MSELRVRRETNSSAQHLSCLLPDISNKLFVASRETVHAPWHTKLRFDEEKERERRNDGVPPLQPTG